MVRARKSDPVILLLATGLFLALVSGGSAAGLNAPVSPLQQSPVLPSMQLFIPSSGSIHSTQVNDAVNGKEGRILFATSYGLSEYNGTWKTRHLTRQDLRFSLLDDFVTALEYDPQGNLWIGFAEGIQIDNGSEYRIIRDQQLLKSLRIKDLQRWGDTMWVATGNSGIHRFSNGTWTWFKPMSPDGPGFYEADSLALDPRNDVLYIATEEYGVWLATNESGRIRFRRIDTSTGIPPPVLHVRQSPLGGAYFFDRDHITWYSNASGWRTVLTINDVLTERAVINDIEAAPDGTLFIASDNGILIWRDGALVRRLARFEGTGTSAIITWLFLDAQNRLWFATQGNAGYYYAEEAALPVITLEHPEPTTLPAFTQVIAGGADSGITPVPERPNTAMGDRSGELTILDRLMQLFSEILRYFTGNAGSR